MYVEPCDPYPTKDLRCKLQVTGVSDETAFVLNVKAPKGVYIILNNITMFVYNNLTPLHASYSMEY